MALVARPRISIVRSSERTLDRYAAAAAEMGSVVLAPATPGVPHAVARTLLSTMCDRSGSVVDPPGPGDARRAMLPRAAPHDGDRREAWVHALAFAADGTDAAIVVRARRTDLESLRLLRPTWRRMQSPPPLVLLDSPLEGARRDDPVERVLYDLATIEIAQLRALPWTRREVLTEVDLPRARAPRTSRVPPPLPALGDVRAAFGEHAFDVALLLARELLARGGDLTPGARAELHGLAGLSAASLNGAALATYVEEHLQLALREDVDDDLRACLLVATYAASPSLDAARRAIDASRRVDSPRGRYLEAWARRARAAELSAARVNDAIDDLEEAIALLATRAIDVPEPEVERTRHVLALDLARALALAGDAEGSAAWTAQAGTCASRLPPGWEVPRPTLDLKIDRMRLGDAIAEREAFAARARAEWDPNGEAACMRELSALHACRGETTRSHACARLAKRLVEAARIDAQALLAAELTCGLAAFRAGKLEAAAAALESALGADATSADEAELHAILACVAAKRNQTTRAEDASLEALARLDADAPAEIAARVLVRVGEAYLLLGRADAARRVFALALGWSDTLSHESIAPPDRLALLLGMWEAGERKREIVDLAIACALDALASPDAWAHLPRLQRMLDAVFLDVEDPLLEVVAQIRTLLAQRRPTRPPSERPDAQQPQKKPFLDM